MAVAEQTVQWLIQDQHYAVGYTTYIVDLWQGDEGDPAVNIERYLGVWHTKDIDNTEMGEPDWAEAVKKSYLRRPKPDPVIWEHLATPKAADDAARLASRHDEEMMRPIEDDDAQYRYNPTKTKKNKLYQAFIAAIDTLGADDSNVEAWAAVGAWRDYNAKLHEK